MGSLIDLWHLIMSPLYYAISAIMIGWHNVWSALGLDPAGGLSWVLSIIGLTLVIRAALIPLFVKQIKSSRNMQLIQPKVKELQKKHGHDRERLAQETMKLYKDSGTNPFASCLPILLQMPIFFALFSLLNNASKGVPKGFLSKEQAEQFGNAELPFGVPISETFLKADGHVPTMVLCGFLVLAMTATTFLTQRQLMSKNMPPDALSGPYAQQQKLLLYVLPVVFAVGGIAFPVGVLFYWTTSNLWTMGQQFYVIRNNPAPGTAAATAKVERDRHKAERKGLVVATEPVVEPEATRRPQQRQQPQRQSRSQRRGGARPANDSPKDADGVPSSTAPDQTPTEPTQPSEPTNKLPPQAPTKKSGKGPSKNRKKR